MCKPTGQTMPIAANAFVLVTRWKPLFACVPNNKSCFPCNQVFERFHPPSLDDWSFRSCQSSSPNACGTRAPDWPKLVPASGDPSCGWCSVHDVTARRKMFVEGPDASRSAHDHLSPRLFSSSPFLCVVVKTSVVHRDIPNRFTVLTHS